MRLAASLMSAAVLSLVLGPAVADWDPGDDYKMHFPQLPDPNGWDVNATEPKVLADDWMCTETGFVSDIHFWGSWELDEIGEILEIRTSIHENIPDDPNNPDDFSKPGALLWEHRFLPGDWSERVYGTGDQGWYDPDTGFWNRPDHFTYYQYNLENIPQPFFQEEGTIYWLDISVTLGRTLTTWGWKTSQDHWEDDAVWSDSGQDWHELRDPISGESLDMAFVITPEPGSLGLLGMGVLVLLRRR